MSRDFFVSSFFSKSDAELYCDFLGDLIMNPNHGYHGKILLLPITEYSAEIWEVRIHCLSSSKPELSDPELLKKCFLAFVAGAERAAFLSHLRGAHARRKHAGERERTPLL